MPEADHSPRYHLTHLGPLLAQGRTVLTPTIRLARHVRRAWNQAQAQAGLQAWASPAVLPLDAYIEARWRQAVQRGDLPPRVLAGTMQLTELWRRVIDEDLAQRGEAALLQPGAAAELARDARELLLRWRLDPAAPSLVSSLLADPDCASFHRWLQRFQRSLDQHAMVSLADIAGELLKLPTGAAQDRVVLLDFDDVAPLQRACLEHVCIEVSEVQGGVDEARSALRAFPDRDAELQAVAAWAAHQHRAHPGESLGIILGDPQDRGRLEYLLRREFGCLGQNYTALPVNFSMGITLDRAPVVRDALLALASAGERMPLNAVLALLRSRFLAGGGAADAALLRLLENLYRDGRPEVALSRLRYLSHRDDNDPPAAAAPLLATEGLRLRRRQSLPSQWAAAFGEVLALWHWPGEQPLDSLEYQQVEHWYSTLDTLAGYDTIHGPLGYNEALALLTRLCQQQISQPQTADTPIQVLGPLEGAGLHFDRVWWLGLQGNRWPAAPRPNPFLPVSLQRRHDMPHASSEREWRYADGLLRQYRSCSGELTLSYARHIDGVPELPSPLVAAIEDALDLAAPGLRADWLARQAAGSRTQHADADAPAVDGPERDTLSGGSAILGAQAACPFQAFAAHRLKLVPLDASVTGLSAAERGKLLHEALYTLWGELGGSERLHELGASAQATLIESAVDAALAAMPRSLLALAGRACIELERERLRALLAEWLEQERQREPFTVAAREEALTLEFAGLPLQLRIDRIDQVAGEQRLLIDYKSGRCRLGDWLGAHVREPQLPLYGVVSDVAGLAFAQVRAGDCRFVGLAAVDGTPGVATDIARSTSRYALQADDWAALVTRWRTDLEELARRFLHGDARVDPQPRACDYCGFGALCRIQLSAGQGA